MPQPERFRPAEALAELLWPTRCVCCNLPGELLCDDCRRSLPWIAQQWACPACGAPYGWLTCTECGRSREQKGGSFAPEGEGNGALPWPVRATICSLPFQGAGARLVTCLKDAHELRLAPVVAAAMACSLDEAHAWDGIDGAPRFDALHTSALCFVPATREAFARRGFDHMELVSAALSGILGLPVLDALARRTARDQRELGREARASNLSGTMEVVQDVTSLHLLLVDDVITTGASICEAASSLLKRGAASVTACALARVC
ncbi:MAG: ComF family protein [Atopobiaceae bacterium]|nr:ComF family protein [Atopobiaceae bacterium]MBR1829841.1 ComF family protein [Atopobiaceae bacterium]